MTYFSIIMPAYNAEKYLSLSIESLLKQDFSDWELILINDGSSDGTDRIAKSYAENDPRIRYISKENGGVSSARNTALPLIRGAYTLFVDADDELVPHALRLLHETVNTYAPDAVTYQIMQTDASSSPLFPVTKPFEDGVQDLDTSESIKKYIYTALASDVPFGFIANFTVKSELIRDLRFSTDLVMCEDLLFDMQMYERTKHVVCLPDYLYLYRSNPAGAVRSFRFEKLDNLARIYKEKLAFAERVGIPANESAVLHWFCSNIVYNYQGLLGNRTLEKQFLRRIESDADIMERLQAARQSACDHPHPDYRILIGSKPMRFFLRSKFLLKKRLKRLLRRA